MVDVLKYSDVVAGVVAYVSGRGRGSGTSWCGETVDGGAGAVVTLGTPVEGGDGGVATLGTAAAAGGAGKEGEFCGE